MKYVWDDTMVIFYYYVRFREFSRWIVVSYFIIRESFYSWSGTAIGIERLNKFCRLFSVAQESKHGKPAYRVESGEEGSYYSSSVENPITRKPQASDTSMFANGIANPISKTPSFPRPEL